MADGPATPRRGRREVALDPTAPEHRRVFAQRLRDLRGECGNPAYRVLSRLGHCGSGSLSEAAAGRRLPTWEVTRAYVTSCLRHAGRGDRVDAVLHQWREVWEESAALDRAHRRNGRPDPAAAPDGPAAAPDRPAAEPDRPAAARDRPAEAEERAVPEQRTADGRSAVPGQPVAVPFPAPPPAARSGRPRPPRADPVWRRAPSSRAVAAVAVIAALMMGVLDGSVPRSVAPMSGLYNIVVTPFAASGAHSHLARQLQSTLVRGLENWVDDVPAVQLRGPDRVGDAAARSDRVLHRVAREHGADVVVAGRLRPAAGGVAVTIEFLITDRAFGETPEFVGRHEISVTEPVDVLTGNIAVNADLAEDALRYLRAVVAFVRGLGDYALDDFAGAEDSFVAAEEGLREVGRSAGGGAAATDVVQLMLGNTVGRRDPGRIPEAADHYRRALATNPGYARARIGLAEASRVIAGCRPADADVRALTRALEHYRSALAVAPAGGDAAQAMLRMKSHLGVGLTHQCLAIAGLGHGWAEADLAFGEVLRMHRAARLTDGAARHALRLAAEARAGQALTAYLTAERSDERFGGHRAAAAAYEEALRLLGAIDVVRRTNVQRELVFLRNLRSVYEAMADPVRAADVDRRTAIAERKLATTPDGG